MNREPQMTEASVVRHGEIHLAYDDGTEGELYVLDRMWGPVFERARTPEGFAEARFDPESGTVVWGEHADLAPDTLHMRLSTGVWHDSRAA